MANTSLIPPLNISGLFTFNSPWVSDLTRTFTCTAIRRFSDLAAQNEDVYALYYAPKGLTQADYNADAALGAAIITLENAYSGPIYIPSTYIVSYPDMGAVAYSNVVASIGLGPLWDSIQLDFFAQQLAQVCTSVIGVVPEVLITTAELKTAVSAAQHQTMEAARQAAITNRETDGQKITALEKQVADLQATVSAWEAIADKNGWVG